MLSLPKCVSITILLGVFVAPSFQQGILPNGLELIGVTDTKELYISSPNVTYDFAEAIDACAIRIGGGLKLVAVENELEFALIDNYFNNTQGNASDLVRTSLMSMWSVGPHWATGGETYVGSIDSPWPAGGGGSPNYSWYKCGGIRRTCKRYPNSPPGCWPAYTGYLYTPCNTPLRFICQQTIT